MCFLSSTLFFLREQPFTVFLGLIAGWLCHYMQNTAFSGVFTFTWGADAFQLLEPKPNQILKLPLHIRSFWQVHPLSISVIIERDR